MASAQSQSSPVSQRYAKALFELAKEGRALERVEKTLIALSKALSENADLKQFIHDPAIDDDVQKDVMQSILKKLGTTKLIENFIAVLITNNRLNAIESIIKAFEALLRNDRSETIAHITTAHALKAAQRKELSTLLTSQTGQKVTMNEHIDPSILGGVIVRLGSKMIDTSLKTKLLSLQTAMKEVG